MFALFDHPRRKHFIEDGHVWCPVRGRDVEIDLCMACRSLEVMHLDGEQPHVRCAPEAPRAWLLRGLL